MFSAQEGHELCVRVLLKAGANINIVDNTGNTCLKNSRDRLHRSVVRILVQTMVDAEKLLEEKRAFILPTEIAESRSIPIRIAGRGESDADNTTKRTKEEEESQQDNGPAPIV